MNLCAEQLLNWKVGGSDFFFSFFDVHWFPRTSPQNPVKEPQSVQMPMMTLQFDK